jgi:hypothetical protein
MEKTTVSMGEDAMNQNVIGVEKGAIGVGGDIEKGTIGVSEDIIDQSLAI